jgi:hypothetical protein
MADPEHVKILKGVPAWKRWRRYMTVDPDLRGADLSGANLRFADLSDAKMSHANLSGANLREARLIGTDLGLANLTGADLTGANLSDADLPGANLSGADLSYAKNLTQAQLDGACGDATTKLPEGLTIKRCPLSGPPQVP